MPVVGRILSGACLRDAVAHPTSVAAALYLRRVLTLPHLTGLSGSCCDLRHRNRAVPVVGVAAPHMIGDDRATGRDEIPARDVLFVLVISMKLLPFPSLELKVQHSCPLVWPEWRRFVDRSSTITTRRCRARDVCLHRQHLSLPNG